MSKKREELGEYKVGVGDADSGRSELIIDVGSSAEVEMAQNSAQYSITPTNS